MLNNLIKLPSWALYILIVTTVVLSIVILVQIWFPELLDTEIFLKTILTYIVIVVSSAIIAKIAEYIKVMEEKPHE